jgi:hypothetical protein
MLKTEPKTNHQCDELNYFIPEGLRVAMLFLQRKISVVDILGE